jgi:hypothetical protein
VVLFIFYATIRGTVQPNKITWFLWGAFPMVAFVAQSTQGVNFIAWATFVAGLYFLIVLAATLNPKAYWQPTRRDYLCMVIAIIGIVLWAATDIPNLAIVFALLAALAAGIPTIIKVYQYPDSESWGAYAVSTLGFSLALLAVSVWTFENYAFVSYLLLANLLLALLSLPRRCTLPS